MGTGVCFKCGKPGHIARNCPMEAVGNYRTQGTGFQYRQPAQAQVYSLTPTNAEAEAGNTNVVTGIIPLSGCLACTLFDSGATHSFISSSYVKVCKLSMQPLEQNISVVTPVGDAITCRKYVEDCPIIVRDKTLPAKLAVLKCLDSMSYWAWIG